MKNHKDVEEIFKKYSNQIYYFLFRLTHDHELSEDITQETFYIAVKNINKFRGECKIDVWLCQIAKHLYYKELARQKKNKFISIYGIENNIVNNQNIELDLFYKEDKKWVYERINKLDKMSQNIVLLRISANLTFKQIATILNKTETYVRVKFYRIKKSLKEENQNEKEK